MVKVYTPPKVYTSYFGRVPALLKEGFVREQMMAIVRHRMPYIDKRIRNCSALAPFPALLDGYKRGLVDEFSYRILYRDWLDNKYDVRKTIERIQSMGIKIFLCYETVGKFCHRQVFGQWLTDNGLPCEEWAPTYHYPAQPWNKPQPTPPEPTTPLLIPPHVDELPLGQIPLF